MRLAALVMVLLALPAFARVSHSEAWAREKFAAAGRMREALNGRPAPERARREYLRVIEAYRRVYYGSPTSAKADASVVAVAELLAEMGRQFNDDKILRSAIGQYQFLRREYPGSKYRFDALFTIGEIYKDDLSDPTQARTTFAEFLHRYPRNRLADDAKAAIAELDQEATEEAAKKEAATKDKTAKSTNDEDSADTSETATAEQRNTYPRVTGVRHWSTPDYTRVAIDLEQDVKFDSQRIDNPDRIFFDLYGTKLASTLVGKSIDVEDGFLKKVRVAQFQPGRTRVVLEVDDLSEYNAFLLSNPSRLIIDIHGKKSAKASVAQREPKPDQKQEVAKSVAPVMIADEEVPDAKVEKSPARPTTKSAKEREGNTKAKQGAQKASASTSLQKKIVEADDDDDATDVKSPAVQPLVKNSDTSANAQSPGSDLHPQPGVRSHGKRKAADGNNDEVATLDPHDLRPEPKSPAAGTTVPDGSKTTRSKPKRTKKSEPEAVAHEARPTASGDRSLIRALGLKIGRIVIDPGHGGHDTGTIGPNGLEEKELVLDVAKRLGKLLQARMGADVVYTRQDDTFIPLETRTAIANQERADLFVSVHANSSHDPDARGVETYYLNFTSNADALEVAARENAVSDKSIHELQDLVKKIALKEKIDESREFATDVQRSLHSGLAVKSPGIRDRGVRKAPFIVLIGANMPSILAEISFVSNPTDERKLQTAEYRQRIAESLYKGISKYVGGLSGVKVASRMSKSDGQ